MERLMIEIKESINIDVKLSDIDYSALDIASTWRENYSVFGRELHEPRWDWNKELRKFRRRPRRVELAIWSETQLCGLVLGRISDRCVVATIHLIEANPENHPLKKMITPISAQYLGILAASIGAKEISIESPVPDLIEFYKQLGFDREIKKGKKILRLKKILEL
jgi:hypothetical protein